MSGQWKMMQNLKSNWLVISKMTWRIRQILTPALENLKNLLFNRFLWLKHMMFEIKKYRGVIFDGIEDWCNIWRKANRVVNGGTKSI